MLRVSGFGFHDYNRSLALFLLVILILIEFPLFSQTYFNNLEDSTFSSRWINVMTDSGYAHSGHQYAILKTDSPYGLGLESAFPEEIKGTTCSMKVSGWVKSNVKNDRAVFVITVINDKGDLLWRSIELSPVLHEADKWFQFSDSLRIPGAVTNEGIIKAYLWNNDEQDSIAIDDLKFEFTPLPNPSFIPNVLLFNVKPADTTDRLLISNKFYSVFYNEESKSLSVISKSGQYLINNIWYHDERNSGGADLVRDVSLTLHKVKLKKGKSNLIFTAKSAGLDLKIILTCDQESPNIEFFVEEKYKSAQLVGRESLVLQSGQEVVEVYRANRKSEIEDFQEEYWLGKQGAKFGKRINSWLIYHQPGISSLQLNTIDNQLWINLDYNKDHPFLHFPLNNDTTDLIEDWSESNYGRAQKRTYSFSIFAGIEISHLPRFMKNPNGFLATYIWTEHADFTNIGTNRAVYFGSEKITKSENAIGGFVKYNIPVTKSVFYHNPDKITNAEISNGEFQEMESAIKTDSAFQDFLEQIQKTGHDICLHTPEQFTSNKRFMRQALRYMNKHFGSPSWIDHGYNNHAENNREDLVCDGFTKRSSNYSGRLWDKNQIKYFWNPYYEDFLTFDDWQFGQFIDKPFHGFGDFLPNPDYWQHTTRTSEIYHWPTKSVIFINHDEKWDFHFNETILNEFVKSWSVEMNHCYPAWVDSEKGFWYCDENGVVAARNGFNRALERMAKLRDSGKLNIATIHDFLDYQLAVEQVDFEILQDGRIKVTNNSNEEIKGLSFATRSRLVLVDNLEPKQKTADDDLVFWFDLEVGESRIIQIAD